MSDSAQPGPTDEQRELRQEFIDMIDETFAPETQSLQYRYDHPDGDLPKEVGPGVPPESLEPDPDGERIFQAFNLKPFHKFLRRASGFDHPISKHPEALAHFCTHVKKWEKWELGEDDSQFDKDEIGMYRKRLFDWYCGLDKDTPEKREKAKEKRIERLRPGGTGIVIHGEQGTTKTTGMYWLVTQIMQSNPFENTVWQSTLDDTEWQIFAPWATIFFPEGVDVEVSVNPHGRTYRDLDNFSIDPSHIAREVKRYSDPEDLLIQMADRKPGHIYVVYPDPHFRQCQSLTGGSYESMWDVDESDEATDTNHFWFALLEAYLSVPDYNYWTTLVADEAHKWLAHGKGNDEHDAWNKIDDWSTYWGDARKKRLSCILATHKWPEIDSRVRDKVRWGATMNGEEFPSDAPVSGTNDFDQSLGDFCIWNNRKWNHAGYPDLKRDFSVPGDISVSYPGFEAVRRQKS